MTVEQRRSASPVLGSATVQEFGANLHGRLVLPTDHEYDEVRKVFNAMIDRRPALIAQCIDTHDVLKAVRFARSHDLLVAVRGGGHSVAGYSVCDDGLLIDLSLMKQVEVDTEKRIARAQPGMTLGEYVTATEQYGLVSPVGTASDTGIAGLTLGGGYGWLSGKYGMALDNLLAAEVVTAGGQVIRASADEHPDLYWALRGGSGNFGIVTSFEYQLHPVTQVLGGMLLYPFAAAKDVLLDARTGRGDIRVLHRRRLRERQFRREGPLGLRRQLRAAGRDQDEVRPDQLFRHNQNIQPAGVGEDS